MTDPINIEIVDRHAAQWGVERPKGLAHPSDLLLGAEQARLSKDRYLDKECYEQENRRLWTRVWQVACRAESIPNPGDHLPYSVGDQEFMVVRQRDGGVRAFFNACLHRGNLIVRDAGSADELRCPYHGWCWKLDGALGDVPDRYLGTGLNDEDYRLREVGCEIWGGYVFLNPRPEEAPPLREYLGGLVERLDPFRMENQRLVAWHTVEIDCNWKVLTEAFLETYHVPGIHPSLVTVLDETNTGYERFGIHSRMWIPYGLPSVRHRDATQQVVYESYLREHFRERHLDWSGTTNAPDAAGWEPDFDGRGDIPGERNAREFLIARQRAEGKLLGHDYEGLSDDQMIDVDHYHFFPNFVILAKADNTFIIRSRPHPSDPQRCIADFMSIAQVGSAEPWPVPQPQRVDSSQEAVLSNIGEVISQDVVNVACVQRGLRANGLDFVTLTANDVRIRWFHDDMQTYLEGDG